MCQGMLELSFLAPQPFDLPPFQAMAPFRFIHEDWSGGWIVQEGKGYQ
jgi:hypothetical protein